MVDRAGSAAALLLGLVAGGPWITTAHGAPAVGPAPAAARPAEATTLAGAVQRALDRNPAVAVAVIEIERFEAVAAEARAGWLPTLTGSLSYTHLDASRMNGTALLAAQDQLAGSLTLTAPLFAPRPFTQWRHARDDVASAGWNAGEARRQIALAVGRAWLSLLAQHRVIEIAERAEVTARAHYEFAHQQFAGGWGTRIDEVRAEQEVQADRTQVEQARVQLARLREALGVLAGSDHALDVGDGVDLPAPPLPVEAAEEATRSRPDVRFAGQRLSAARHLVRDHWADYSPSLVAIFQPFFQTPATATVPSTGWQALVALSLPIFDGGLRYGQQRERLAIEREARATLDGSLRQAAADVRAAAEAMERASVALVAARDAARLAEEGVKLTDMAYRAGASTNIEVIDAERRARDAATTVAVAEDVQRQALLDLLIASGRFPPR